MSTQAHGLASFVAHESAEVGGGPQGRQDRALRLSRRSERARGIFEIEPGRTEEIEVVGVAVPEAQALA
jgi:hypothetical protein